MILLGQPAPGRDTGLVLFGDTVALLSYIWLVGAVLYLGRCFGLLPEVCGLSLTLVVPYRLVRHPVYLAGVGAVDGLPGSALPVPGISAPRRCSSPPRPSG